MSASLTNVFVIDSLSNIDKYASLSENFAKAVDFIRRNDLKKIAAGKTSIAGDDVYVNCCDADYVSPAERRPELHRVYFDVHVPLTCDEQIGHGVFDARVKADFDEANDVGFYEQDFDWHVVRRGEFCLVWPKTCLHAPAIALGEPHDARKLVAKILFTP